MVWFKSPCDAECWHSENCLYIDSKIAVFKNRPNKVDSKIAVFKNSPNKEDGNLAIYKYFAG